MNCIKYEGELKYLTFRKRIQPTLEGRQIRITVSNTFGTGTMTVDEITVAKGNDSHAQKIDLKSKKTATFNHSKKAVIPQGETLTSDPIDLSVSALDYVTISMYMKNTDHLKIFGLIGGDTFIGSGN